MGAWLLVGLTQRGAADSDRLVRVSRAGFTAHTAVHLLLAGPSAELPAPFLAAHQTSRASEWLPSAFAVCCAACHCLALPGRPMIKALALSCVCHLAPALLPSQYSRNHLVETFLLFSSGIDVSNLVVMARSALSHPLGCDQ